MFALKSWLFSIEEKKTKLSKLAKAKIKSKVFSLENSITLTLVHSPLNIGLSVWFEVEKGSYGCIGGGDKSLALDRPTYESFRLLIGLPRTHVRVWIPPP